MPFSPMPLDIRLQVRLDGRTPSLRDANALVRYISFDDDCKVVPTKIVAVSQNNGRPVDPKYFAIRPFEMLDTTPVLAVTFLGTELSEALRRRSRDHCDLTLYEALIDGDPLQIELAEIEGDPLIIRLHYSA